MVIAKYPDENLPFAIVIANTLEDRKIIQEELGRISGNNNVLVLSRDEVISNPRI
jgi:arginine repressor